MKISLKDIRPNPFRNLEAYPLNQQKVSELVASIEATDAGFWDNVLVRKNGAGYELAYGHHRLEAAKQAGLKEADFIVKKLTDEEMLKIMVLENRSDLDRTQISVLVEGVTALVAAIAAGTVKIEVPKDTKSAALRYAPSFLIGPSRESRERCYTIDSLAFFLNATRKNSTRANDAISTIVNALERAEKKIPGGLTRAKIAVTHTLDELEQLIKATNELEAGNERRRLARERDAEALAKAAERVKEAEARREEANQKAKQDQKEREARIAEEAEKIRIAQEDEDREKAKQAKARMVEEQRRAEERRVEFEAKRAELDAKVEARKKEEAERRRKIDLAETERKGPVVIVEENPVYSANDVLRHVHNAVENLRTAIEKSKAVKTDDLLALRRIKSEAEEGYKLCSKIVMKYQKA